jgi:hypothetical protein
MNRKLNQVEVMIRKVYNFQSVGQLSEGQSRQIYSKSLRNKSNFLLPNIPDKDEIFMLLSKFKNPLSKENLAFIQK